MYVQKEICNTDENEAASNGTSLTITFTRSRLCKKNASIKLRQRSGNVAKSKRFRTFFQAKKALFKVKMVHAKYSINHKEKRKLEHRWGPHLHGNNLGKKRNKCEKASLEMHDELKEL